MAKRRNRARQSERFFQFGWRVGVASSALWVIYFAFQQGIASLYGVTAEKALLAWNHSPATLSAVDDAHKAIQSAIEYSPEHPQYYFYRDGFFSGKRILLRSKIRSKRCMRLKPRFWRVPSGAQLGLTLGLNC